MPTRKQSSLFSPQLAERLWNNVLPFAIICAMILSNSFMQQGLHEIVREFQKVCGAADVHVAWAGDVSVGVGSAINATRSAVEQIDDYQMDLQRRFDDIVFQFSECKDISQVRAGEK